MNDLANKRYMETLDKEKALRRVWMEHDAQKQIFETRSEEMRQLSHLNATLEEACGDPAKYRGAHYKPPSRRQQLVGLRNEIRSTLAVVEQKLEEELNKKVEVDPVVLDAREKAKERMKLPIHLRGSAVLNQTA
ncbi:hypothetical protein AB1Y20_009471 [Prymnesium parvum]|uniref:Enkurin domain-containing protein n=1 Tax=Prymnesium parvum TaxID=97485 RepID=A0AB34K558_PRYPA